MMIKFSIILDDENVFSGKLNIKASFHLPLSFVSMNSRKVFVDLDVISVNYLEGDDTRNMHQIKLLYH